jgi:hypothetical protein
MIVWSAAPVSAGSVTVGKRRLSWRDKNRDLDATIK